MMNIFESATKLVLLMVTISLIGMTWMGVEITEPLKNIAIMVFSFYFGQKINSQK